VTGNVRGIGRYEIRDVAHGEQLTGPRIEDHRGVYATVDAGDDEGMRSLPAGGE
jgi:hypothetical protein